MKKLTIIGIAVLACSFITSCGNGVELPGDPPAPPIIYYRITNRSGHVVSIVHKPSCSQMPDSLVLTDGKHYEFNELGGPYGKIYFFDQYDFTSRLVYYDGRYAIDIREQPLDRNFSIEKNYKFIPDHEYYFTFTKEDYYYAVENGTTIGK